MNYSDKKTWSTNELIALKDEAEIAINEQNRYIAELKAKCRKISFELKRRNENVDTSNGNIDWKGKCCKVQQDNIYTWYCIKNVSVSADGTVILSVASVVTDKEMEVYRSADLFNYTYKSESEYQSSTLGRYMKQNWVSYDAFKTMVDNFNERFSL